MPDGKVRAYTTILTLFQNLEKKGHVRKEKSGRAYIYEAAQPKESVIAEAVEEFVINTFCGHLPKAILFLLAAARLSAEEKDEIQKVLQKSKTRTVKGKTSKVPTGAKTNKTRD